MHVSTTETVTERVLALLERIAQTDEVRRNLDVELYDEHLLDSLGTVQLMVYLGEDFDIEITPSEVDREEWATPRKIVRYVERRVAA